MALAAQQDVPEKPKVQEPWTFKRLFPFVGAVSTLVKTTNPFELFGGLMITFTGLLELLDRDTLWLWYVTMLLILSAAFYLRYLKETKKEDLK